MPGLAGRGQDLPCCIAWILLECITGFNCGHPIVKAADYWTFQEPSRRVSTSLKRKMNVNEHWALRASGNLEVTSCGLRGYTEHKQDQFGHDGPI